MFTKLLLQVDAGPFSFLGLKPNRRSLFMGNKLRRWRVIPRIGLRAHACSNFGKLNTDYLPQNVAAEGFGNGPT